MRNLKGRIEIIEARQAPPSEPFSVADKAARLAAICSENDGGAMAQRLATIVGAIRLRLARESTSNLPEMSQ